MEVWDVGFPNILVPFAAPIDKAMRDKHPKGTNATDLEIRAPFLLMLQKRFSILAVRCIRVPAKSTLCACGVY